MIFDHSFLVVPKTEEDVSGYDWDAFLKERGDHGRNGFAVIDEFTEIEGKLVTRTTFIHGHVKGLIFAESVTIEKSGTVGGLIFCRTLNHFGKADASIICDRAVIRNGARLAGALKYQVLTIEAGGIVSGTFTRREDAIRAKREPATTSTVNGLQRKVTRAFSAH